MSGSIARWGAMSLAALVIATPAVAQDKVTLKFAHQFPITNHLWTEGGQVLADAVTEATHGAVEFQVFPSGQLGTDNVALLTSGLADLVAIVPSYAPEKVPLSSVVELPGLFATSCEGTAKANRIAKKDGLLDQAEYAPQGFRALFVVTSTPYSVMTKGHPVHTMEDLAKLRIRAGGGGMDATMRALGGTPVLMSATELYDSMQRGTLDGAMFPYYPLANFGLDTSFDYSTEGVPLGAASIIYAMREDSWNKLSPEVQAAFDEASTKAQRHLCGWMDEEDVSERARLTGEGLEVITLAEDEALRWNEKLTDVANGWVATVEKTGRKAQPLLDAMREQAPAQ